MWSFCFHAADQQPAPFLSCSLFAVAVCGFPHPHQMGGKYKYYGFFLRFKKSAAPAQATCECCSLCVSVYMIGVRQACVPEHKKNGWRKEKQQQRKGDSGACCDQHLKQTTNFALHDATPFSFSERFFFICCFFVYLYFFPPLKTTKRDVCRYFWYSTPSPFALRCLLFLPHTHTTPPPRPPQSFCSSYDSVDFGLAKKRKTYNAAIPCQAPLSHTTPHHTPYKRRPRRATSVSFIVHPLFCPLFQSLFLPVVGTPHTHTLSLSKLLTTPPPQPCSLSTRPSPSPLFLGTGGFPSTRTHPPHHPLIFLPPPLPQPSGHHSHYSPPHLSTSDLFNDFSPLSPVSWSTPPLCPTAFHTHPPPALPSPVSSLLHRRDDCSAKREGGGEREEAVSCDN